MDWPAGVGRFQFVCGSGCPTGGRERAFVGGGAQMRKQMEQVSIMTVGLHKPQDVKVIWVILIMKSHQVLTFMYLTRSDSQTDD